MAKAQKSKIKVEVDGYSLELSKQEAEILLALTRVVGGSGPKRVAIDSIHDTLRPFFPEVDGYEHFEGSINLRKDN